MPPFPPGAFLQLAGRLRNFRSMEDTFYLYVNEDFGLNYQGDGLTLDQVHAKLAELKLEFLVGRGNGSRIHYWAATAKAGDWWHNYLDGIPNIGIRKNYGIIGNLLQAIEAQE